MGLPAAAQPSMGRVVRILASNGDQRPAMIQSVLDEVEGRLCLTVFTKTGVEYVPDVPFSPVPKEKHWHWPPGTPEAKITNPLKENAGIRWDGRTLVHQDVGHHHDVCDVCAKTPPDVLMARFRQHGIRQWPPAHKEEQPKV